MSACIKVKIEPYLSSCTKLKSKWFKNCNIKPDTLNWVEEKVGDSLELIYIGDNFLNRTPTAQVLIPIIDNWDRRKLKVCKTKSTVKRIKWQPTKWEKIYITQRVDI